MQAAGEGGEAPAAPLLTVAFHPDPVFIGRRHVLPEGEPIALGRLSSHFGRGALDHDVVSRQHVRITRSGERVSVQDLGSRNGTSINGVRIGEQVLEPGDVVGVGPVLLLHHLGPVLAPRLRPCALVGASGAHARLLAEIERAASHRGCVLIQGETGVGKELVATEIHGRSGLAGRLVAVNCGALADGVVHSELFGHVRGAFSGAGRERAGLVRAAGGGTLFLDEVGDGSPALQASLLRPIEQAEYRPVGSDELAHTDARFVAASHVPLEPAVESGRFRRDLYGRISRWVIDVPPLRQRPDDIIPLAQHFARQAAGRPVRLSRALALALLRHPWPGNARQLRAVIEQALADVSPSGELDAGGRMAERLLAAGPCGPPAFEAAGGSVKRLAAELGVSRQSVYRWIEQAGIDLPDLRHRQGHQRTS
ncbi:MAG: sigma 54-interacting transcriptional regulator [Deltaproteobacteria bacterium]|nr:sigma 54-interacting transcriptional regulator [Deltaproteobacteria bacterium]